MKNKIQADLVSAMKTDKTKVETLRSIISSITNGEKENGNQPLTDEQSIKVLAKMVKDRKNSIEQFSKANRNDLVEKEQFQIDILNNYLPSALNSDELKRIISDIIKNGQYLASDMGKIMKEFNSKYAGRADGKTVSDTIKASF